MRLLILSSVLTVIFLLVSCDKDNSTEPQPIQPRDFTVMIENVSAIKPYLSSGVFNTPVGAASPAPIGPGEAYEVTFDAPPGSKLSFATMLVHSNDFFYAPGEAGIDLFNGSTAVSGDITSQIKLWDAGTETNQEPGLGADQAPRQVAPNTGDADPDNTVREAPDTYGNLPTVSDVIQVTLTSTDATEFKLRIENISTSTTLMTSEMSALAVPLAPGVFVVHEGSNPLFTIGQSENGHGLENLAEDGDPSSLVDYLAMNTGITNLLAPGIWAVHMVDNVIFVTGQADAGDGLEPLAEDGDPSVLASSLAVNSDIKSSGVFNTPSGQSSPAPAFPGDIYTFTFTAQKGDRLSFASMLVQSNDLFYAPDGMGIDLFDDDNMPVEGNITAQIKLWDAGTEQNEKPGIGLNQAPRQSDPDTGPDEDGIVKEVDDGYSYPDVSEVIEVTIQVN